MNPLQLLLKLLSYIKPIAQDVISQPGPFFKENRIALLTAGWALTLLLFAGGLGFFLFGVITLPILALVLAAKEEMEEDEAAGDDKVVDR